MPRQFGLKPASAAVPPPVIACCGSALGLIAWMFPSWVRAPNGDTPMQRVTSYLTLPYAPASWRGSRRRRTVSLG